MRYILFSIISSLLATLPAAGAMRINEFMQSNIDLMLDDLNDFPDSWVELYNDSDEPVELGEYSLGIQSDPDLSWPLRPRTIYPGQFVIVYCDKAGEWFHTHFRLESGKGGAIYLFRNGEVADKILDIKKMPAPGISYGYLTESDPQMGYQAVPTPGQPNCGRILKEVLGEPVFSEPGRVSNSPFLIFLTLSLPKGAPEGTEIRYTLDGSEPTLDSPLYTEPLWIAGDVVRARLFHPDYLSPRSTVHSYIQTDHPVDLPVVSIVGPEEYFYDEKIGILVEGTYKPERPNYNFDWRRPVNIEFFPTPGEQSVVNQLIETRVKGGASRVNELKSMVLYANKRFGVKRLEHEFFPDGAPGLTDWKSLELRNAGNDHGYLYCRDGVIQTLFGRNTGIDFQPYRPAVLMINGRYVGPLNLRSRSNEDHIYTFYDGLEDIDMIENWEELKAGDWEAFDAFREFFTEPGHTYEEYAGWLDVEEFADIMIMNAFFDNRDFPGNNIVWWRPQTADGRWRIVAKDTDYGLGLKNYLSEYPTLSWLLDPEFGDDSEKHAPYTLLFRHLMETDEFRSLFIERAWRYLDSFLSVESVSARIRELTDMNRKEVEYYRSTVNQWWIDYDTELASTLRWVEERVPFFYRHLAEVFGVDDLAVGDIGQATSASVEVYDIAGRAVGSYPSEAAFKAVSLPTGIYILRRGAETKRVMR